jgi:hypothetical protein
VQRLTLDFAGRKPTAIATAWVDKMVAAVRKHDREHLVTVGVIPWAMTWPKAKSIVYCSEASKNLDFVSVHFYPRRGEVDEALDALKVYDIGKPIVIEEMFPLNCPVSDLDLFVERSRRTAAGWIGFYWGKTVSEYKQAKGGIADAITLDWLEYFTRKTQEILRTTDGPEEKRASGIRRPNTGAPTAP